MKRRPALPAVFLVFVVSVSASAQEGSSGAWEDFQKKFPPAKKNAAAEEVERLAAGLGIDWNPEDPNSEHPTKEDADAYNQAAFGSWIDSQVKISDDFIAPPPPRVREFLDRHQSALGQLVGRLIGDQPDFGYEPGGGPEQKRPELLPVLRLNRLLVAASLAEERAGHHVEAGQFLDASWSLSASFLGRPDTLSLLISIAASKSQVGALRKLTEPPFGWLNRMSSDRPWAALIDSCEIRPFEIHAKTLPEGAFFDAWTRGWRAVANYLRERSVCAVSKLSADEIWAPMDNELRRAPSEEGGNPEQIAQVFKDISAANVLQALRRGARLAVDCELTAKILELRLERAADRKNRWPEKLAITQSRICPEASYEYQLRGAAMMIRFKGAVTDPDSPALVLPLSFEARPPSPTATPTRSPQPTRTPAPRS